MVTKLVCISSKYKAWDINKIYWSCPTCAIESYELENLIVHIYISKANMKTEQCFPKALNV